MRKKVHQQLPLVPAGIDHEHGHELAEMSAILDEAPGMAKALDLAESDLLQGARADTGREGMTAEQTVRALVIKQMKGYTYEELAFHLADSATYRRFCRFGVGDKVPRKSALQDNIKRLRPATIEAVDRCVLGLAKAEGFEDGRRVRGDCTVVETNIHGPTDSSLLNDVVRVLTRLLKQAEQEVGTLSAHWCDHTRRARKRTFGISNARGAKQRIVLYRDLLVVTRQAVGYAEVVAQELELWWPEDGDLLRFLRVADIRTQLLHFVDLAERAIDQAERRVVLGEQVPASEKLFSIFEPHTDIILKGGRDPEYGHKVFLTSGRSGLVLDSLVLKGNPADATLIESFLERHVAFFGGPPRQVAFDGGFTSRDNLDYLKAEGVQDVAFHKKRGLRVADMVRSSWLYRQLVRFRSGIESGISFLKRCLGWARCLWRGFQSFAAYVKAGVLTCNLLVFARHRLARQAS